MAPPAIDFAGLFDASPNPYLVLDRALNIAGANRAYLRLVKRELDDIIGRRAWAAFPTDPEAEAQAIASFNRAIATRCPDTVPLLRVDVPAPAADGGGMATRYWRITHLPVLGGDGEVAFVLQHCVDVTDRSRAAEALDDTERRLPVLFTDITQRRRMAEELRAFNDRLATRAEERTRDRDAIWEASRDLFVVIGDGGIYRTVNPAWTELLGWRTDELVGAGFADFVHPDDFPAVSAMADRVRAGEKVDEVDLRMRTADGGHRWIAWSIVRRDAMLYAAGRDITDRRRLEDQLRQARKMEAVGQLTGGLAHDFNNLLTAVTGGLELLAHRIASGRTDGLDRYIDMAQSGAQRAAALTQRLLAFSRRQTLAPVPTDVDRLVAGMTEIVGRTLGPAIDVKVVATAELWPVLVDAPQLENALLNLCINARDAMPDGGGLTIETGNHRLDGRAAAEHDLPAGEYVSLCITDTGTGMAPDVIARVFDPFFTTKPIGEGTGLGLSTIYGFVRQSGGQVRIQSRPGHGTTMSLYLPRHLGDSDAADRERVDADRPRGTAGETVLVVEDEDAIRSLMSEILTDAGYRVLEARDGPAGVRMLRSDERIDLLITDVGLPGGLNRRQVADAGRAARPDLRVLFVTGYAANAAVGAGHMDGGMAVLTKPFNLLDLERRVREMISAG